MNTAVILMLIKTIVLPLLKSWATKTNNTILLAAIAVIEQVIGTQGFINHTKARYK